MTSRVPSLTSLAVRLEAEAHRLQALVAPPELGLASDLLMCAKSLRRLSRSGPVLVRLLGPGSSPPPLFAETTAQLDLLSFITTADMALSTFADRELRLASIVPARSAISWRVYLAECETIPTPPVILPELRRLDLRLVEARNRLLAHRLRGHSLRVVLWRRTRRVQIALVPAVVPAPAVASMRGLARRLGVRSTGPLVEVVDHVLEAAGSLDPGSRPHAVDLLREVGYYSGDPSLVVRDLIAITRTIA